MKKFCNLFFKLTAMLFLLLVFAIPGANANEDFDSLQAPQGYMAAMAVPNIDASDDVLILKDINAWGSPANEQILKDLGIAYSVAGSANYGVFDLNNYHIVLVVSDQPPAFYNAFQSHLAEFEAFVNSGGVLIFNGADKGWQSGFWSELPGGVHHKKVYDRNNFVVDETHAITQGMPSQYTGYYASHDHFIDFPAGTRLITRDSGGEPTTIEYTLGSGRIIASGVTLEACYGWGWTAGPMLVNTIKYALGLKGIVPREPPAIRLDPEAMPQVALNIGETADRILEIHNDGEMDLSFNLRIRPMLEVKGMGMPADVSGSEQPPPNYIAEIVNANFIDGADVLLIKDVDPWATKANEMVLDDLGISYSIARSNDFETLVLTPYTAVIIASDQPQAFYNAFNQHFAKFEDYVNGGGVLQFNGADQGWQNGFWAEIPGGVTHARALDRINYIADPYHAIAEGMPSVYSGSYASHAHFANPPAGADLITKDGGGIHTTIEYTLGAGRVIASGVTLEACYAWGWQGGKLLVNSIRRAVGDAPPPIEWLTSDIASGSIAPGGVRQVNLRYDASGLEIGEYNAEIVVMSNDPVNASVKAPAQLKVGQINCPKANAQETNLCQNESVSITLTADQGGLTYSLVDNPSHGVLSGSAPNLTYTPNSGYYGDDSFTFKASNGVCDSNTATVAIHVARPLLSVAPASISEELAKGRQITKTLTIKNDGCGALNYEVAVTEKKTPGAQNLAGGLGMSPGANQIPPGVQFVQGELIVKPSQNADPNALSVLAGQVGVKTRERIPQLNLEIWKLPPEGANDVGILGDIIMILSEDPNVNYAEPNYQWKAIEIPNNPQFPELWGLNNDGQLGCSYDGKENGFEDADIDAPQAWDIFKGSDDVVVAVIDSGIDYNHENLRGNMWVNEGEIPGDGIDNDNNGHIDDIHGYDFGDDDGDPMDTLDHGTHCAGTIGATGDSGVGACGVNHTVRIMACKFMPDDSMFGNTAAAIKGILYAVDNGADILNNSWGGGGYNKSLYEAIAYANDRNVLFVAAAHNDGLDRDLYPGYPCNYELPNVISVAASDCQDQLAWFSGWGKESVHLAAPGVRILSPIPGDKYGYKNGTSMATPHVAGVAALLKGYRPSLTALQIKELIMESVDPVEALIETTITGGRLNAQKALEAAGGSEWISLNGGLNGQIQAGASVTIDVLLNAAGDKVGGDYTANINVAMTDDPNNPQKIVVPVMLKIQPDQHLLKVNKIGNGKVKVDGVLQSLPWEQYYAEQNQITLEAVPDPAPWKFEKWSGVGLIGEKQQSITVTMDADRVVTAAFSQETFYTLNIEKNGEGQVNVDGVLQSLPWTGTYAQGASVQVEAVPAEQFVEWFGDLQGSANPASLTMDANKTIKPVFEFKEKWKTTITAEGEKINGMEVLGYDEWILQGGGGENVLVNQSKATFGVDTKAKPLPAPPPAPQYSVEIKLFQITPPDNWNGPYFMDIRTQGEQTYEWILMVNPVGNIQPPIVRTATISWDPKTFNQSGTYKLMKGYEGDGEVAVQDMRTTTQYEVSNKETEYFTIVKSEGAFEMHLQSGWNMVSLPVLPDNPNVNAVFPNAEAVFKFDGAGQLYEPVEVLEANIGYWVKVPEEAVVNVAGQQVVRNFAMNLGEGWHLIGAPYAEARPEPLNKIEVMYGFDYVYFQAHEVHRGKAFWVKIKEGGCQLSVSSQ